MILTARLKRTKLFPSDLTASQRKKKKKSTCSSIETLKYPVLNQVEYYPQIQSMQWSRKRKKWNEMKQEKKSMDKDWNTNETDDTISEQGHSKSYYKYILYG